MYPWRHEKANCRDKERCTGPGCRLNTGKTRRRRESPHKRERKNKRRATLGNW